MYIRMLIFLEVIMKEFKDYFSKEKKVQKPIDKISGQGERE